MATQNHAISNGKRPVFRFSVSHILSHDFVANVKQPENNMVGVYILQKKKKKLRRVSTKSTNLQVVHDDHFFVGS